MKKKNLLVGLLSMAFVATSAVAVSACNDTGETSKPTEFEQVYAQYVVYAQAEGIEPLSYEEWLSTIKGEKGDKGDKGDEGKSTYEIWLEQGYSGTEADFIAWLKESKHEHKFGEWTAYTEDDSSCENRLYFRICSTCNMVEGKKGTYTDHNWKEDYSVDNSFHWVECENCEVVKDKAEHTPDDSGICTVCETPMGATVGVMYDISADGTYAEVIGYEGTATTVCIADTYEGLPVKTIYERAFDNKSIVSVIIPDSVTSICYMAFSSCDKLSYNEYGNCKYLGSANNPYYALIETTNSNYSTYTIHENTKIIGDYAFSQCSRMSSITIPDSVTTIGKSAFYSCDSLTSVVIPDSVTTIGKSAFIYCSSLTNVVIGDSVTTIGESAFYSCTSLKSVYYKGTVEEWSKISISSYNNYALTNATRYYYSESKPTTDGNYWHYDENGNPVAW